MGEHTLTSLYYMHSNEMVWLLNTGDLVWLLNTGLFFILGEGEVKYISAYMPKYEKISIVVLAMMFIMFTCAVEHLLNKRPYGFYVMIKITHQDLKSSNSHCHL